MVLIWLRPTRAQHLAACTSVFPSHQPNTGEELEAAEDSTCVLEQQIRSWVRWVDASHCTCTCCTCNCPHLQYLRVSASCAGCSRYASVHVLCNQWGDGQAQASQALCESLDTALLADFRFIVEGRVSPKLRPCQPLRFKYGSRELTVQ